MLYAGRPDRRIGDEDRLALLIFSLIRHTNILPLILPSILRCPFVFQLFFYRYHQTNPQHSCETKCVRTCSACRLDTCVKAGMSVKGNCIRVFFLIGVYFQLAVCPSIVLKINKIPHLCWDLNPQPLAYEARTIPQDHQGS